MPFVILFVIGMVLMLPWWTGSTFGQQCAKSFQSDTPAYERCVERMDRGGTVHFEKKVVMVPAE